MVAISQIPIAARCARTASQRGAAMVEAVFSLSVLLALAISFIGIIYISYQALSVQFVAQFGIRELIVGPGSTGVSIGAHALAVRDKIRNRGLGMGLAINDSHITICPADTPACGVVTAFVPNQLMIVRIALPINIAIFSVSGLEGIGIGRNEPVTQ